MIFTRSWLSEFIDIEAISDVQIMDTLNKTGIEVAAYKKLELPKGVVVGKIIDFEKHPNADKLSVCKVDSGIGVQDIVCGAQNVKKDALVALATIGAKLPGGVTIKHAELRGVQSYGMLCSSTELGLPKSNDGIMILDGSIEKIKIGEELAHYPQIADSVFEVEITPNRGDCLSVYGIARELGAYYGLELKEIDVKAIKESEKGIGRILSLHSNSKISANTAFRVYDASSTSVNDSFLVDLRLSLFEDGSHTKKTLDKICDYTAKAVGVNVAFLGDSSFSKTEGKIDVKIDTLDSGLEVIGGKKGELLTIGVRQLDDSKPKETDENILLCATYIPPNVVLEANWGDKQKDDSLYFRSSRGSEPNLSLGINYAAGMMSKCCDVVFYAGLAEDEKPIGKDPIKVDIGKINTIVGAALDKNHIVTLLRKLYFGVTVNAEFDSCVVQIPAFRHDISNVYDLAEEIVRIKGIDTIASVPMSFCEKNRINESYSKYLYLKKLREKAAAQGFFESVHFIFADRTLQERFGFESLDESLELLNPITSELNTLRSTLLLNILSSASKNGKNSQKKIALFESGTVFAADRSESHSMAFVWSGADSFEGIKNSGKPAMMDLGGFISKIVNIIGEVELVQEEPKSEFFHPYQYARIIKDGANIGFISKLNHGAEEFFELKDTFVCEISVGSGTQKKVKAAEFSKFQKSDRDITLNVSSTFAFAPIKKCLDSLCEPLLKEFYPIDVYKDKSDKEHIALTIRLVMQSNERTLEERDIVGVVDKALAALQSELGIGLK
mgnify:FL=1